MKRRAFSLIEIMCVIALIAVIGLVLAVLFKHILDIERIQAGQFNRMLEVNALADQFRADVAQAERILPEWQDYTAGKETLILATKSGGRVIYRWEENRLLRRAFEKGGLSERHIPISDRQTVVEFVGPGHGLKVLRVRLHRLRHGEQLAGHSMEIAAALAGDWR